MPPHEVVNLTKRLTKDDLKKLNESIEAKVKLQEKCRIKGHKGIIYIKKDIYDYYGGSPEDVYVCKKCDELYIMQQPSLFPDNYIAIQLPF
ncbi:MAG TPA: hypothetical protein VJB94_01135 [Candidatus Nanoarchaeia archaeon]|nr:hypothetical protein [Candidatus Nanoarchaeia archaeon]